MKIAHKNGVCACPGYTHPDDYDDEIVAMPLDNGAWDVIHIPCGYPVPDDDAIGQPRKGERK